VTETMEAGRSDRTNPQLPSFLMTSAGRRLGVVVCALLILAAAIGSYFAARVASDNELKAANLRILQVQNENQKLVADNTNQLGTIADLQIQIKNAQTKLAVILPTENTYNINPNQSLIVAGGRLTIGLIGSPTNESVNININGKPQTAAVGAVINSVLDASTTCQVGVQSFDMFKAVLTATCASAKPQ
jgi:cell division protein FtsB